jgi:hypothetical protein
MLMLMLMEKQEKSLGKSMGKTTYQIMVEPYGVCKMKLFQLDRDLTDFHMAANPTAEQWGNIKTSYADLKNTFDLYLMGYDAKL